VPREATEIKVLAVVAHNRIQSVIYLKTAKSESVESGGADSTNVRG
jgi:hypothetical protein